jgi:hypothetical protein
MAIGATLDLARQLIAVGVSVIPIRTDGSKAPCIRWARFQRRIATFDELDAMFSGHRGIAAVAGPVSGGLEALDFEAQAPFSQWVDLVGQLSGIDVYARLVVVRTPSGGYHVVYRCPAVEGNTKLAMHRDVQGKLKVLIETRGRGGYFILPGSPASCHPSGNLYQVLQGDFRNLPTITSEERTLLIRAARSFDEIIIKTHQFREPPRGGVIVNRPGDDFNRRATWPDILSPSGWKLVGNRGSMGFWRRPGKTDGLSATTGFGGTNFLYVFSTNAAPLEHNRAYRPFAAYALLHHDGDFRKAATDLAGKGYGSPVSADQEPAPAMQTAASSPWENALSAPVFIDKCEDEVAWLLFPFLAPGSVTQIFAPRGIGKTHFALAIGVQMARLGHRVLLLDRDNSQREVRRRLKGWGASDTSTLCVMTRDQVPSLTDVAVWAMFPFSKYDIVLIDSLDSSTEGVGEKDSGKPSRAIAPLLDIAHRDNGPAILALGNTIKSGQHSRGCGIVEDRADICFEVRDATAFKPTGEKNWWEELPAAGVDAWAQRSSRRQRRDIYRLAFIPSKFRIGEEPNPIVLEITLGGDLWQLREVTNEMTRSGADALELKHQNNDERLLSAVRALAHWIQDEADKGHAVLLDRDAVPFLMKLMLTRSEAQTAIKGHEGQYWTTHTLEHHRGRPKVLAPCGPSLCQKPETTAEINQSKTLQSSITCNGGISPDPVNIERGKSIVSKPVSVTGSSGGALFPPSSDEHDRWSEKV